MKKLNKKDDMRQFRSSRWWSNVQALRIDCGLNEKDFSVYLGKNENYINSAVKNGGVPNIADALMIAQAFDTSVEDLAFGSIGLEIRKAQLEAELQRITEEIEDARKDIGVRP